MLKVIIIFLSIIFVIVFISNNTKKIHANIENIENIEKNIINDNIEHYEPPSYRGTLKNISPQFTDNFDWATANNQYARICMNPIRNQGNCGSCYAFAIISMIESALFRYEIGEPGSQLKILSVQQIIDCTSTRDGIGDTCDGCMGCPFEYVNDYFSSDLYICRDNDYPYTAGGIFSRRYNYPGCQQNSRCGSNDNFNAVYVPKIKFYKIENIPDINTLKQYIYTLGPLYWSVIIPKQGIEYTWTMIFGGIYKGSFCLLERDGYPNPRVSDCSFDISNRGHALIITGWRIGRNSENYWIVRNSWGKGFANKGYFFIPMLPPVEKSLKASALIYRQLYTGEVERPQSCVCNANIELNANSLYYFFIIKAKRDKNSKIICTISSDDNNIIKNMKDINGNIIDDKGKKIVDDQDNYYKTEKKDACDRKKGEFCPYFYYKVENRFNRDDNYSISVKVQVVNKTNGTVLATTEKTYPEKPLPSPIIPTSEPSPPSITKNITINYITLFDRTIKYTINDTIKYDDEYSYALLKIADQDTLEGAEYIFIEKIGNTINSGTITKKLDTDSSTTKELKKRGLYQFYILKISDTTPTPEPYSNSLRVLG
jgi:hypothetical protein